MTLDTASLYLTRRATLALLAATGAAVPMAATAQDSTTDAAAPEIVDYAIGALDAKVKISEYASFTCPHCAHFHEDIYPKLKADYIDTGKVRFEYREVYFDKYGLWAAMMARCGGEMRYFGITDILFSTQGDWAGSDDQAQVIENIKKIGRTAGMEDAALDVCLQDNAMAKALVTHYQTNATADGLEGTPMFMINGVKHSNMSYEDMKLILDAELAK